MGCFIRSASHANPFAGSPPRKLLPKILIFLDHLPPVKFIGPLPGRLAHLAPKPLVIDEAAKGTGEFSDVDRYTTTCMAYILIVAVKPSKDAFGEIQAAAASRHNGWHAKPVDAMADKFPVTGQVTDDHR
jgi:hypothetical protein